MINFNDFLNAMESKFFFKEQSIKNKLLFLLQNNHGFRDLTISQLNNQLVRQQYDNIFDYHLNKALNDKDAVAIIIELDNLKKNKSKLVGNINQHEKNYLKSIDEIIQNLINSPEQPIQKVFNQDYLNYFFAEEVLGVGHQGLYQKRQDYHKVSKATKKYIKSKFSEEAIANAQDEIDVLNIDATATLTATLELANQITEITNALEPQLQHTIITSSSSAFNPINNNSNNSNMHNSLSSNNHPSMTSEEIELSGLHIHFRDGSDGMGDI